MKAILKKIYSIYLNLNLDYPALIIDDEVFVDYTNTDVQRAVFYTAVAYRLKDSSSDLYIVWRAGSTMYCYSLAQDKLWCDYKVKKYQFPYKNLFDSTDISKNVDFYKTLLSLFRYEKITY